MISNKTILLLLVSAMVISQIIVPILRKLAIQLGLVDKPNARKVHITPIPLVGGISVWTSALIALLVIAGDQVQTEFTTFLFTGSGLLLLMGTIDDKANLNPLLKLFVQLLLGHMAFTHGIKIESFYGVFGIETLSENLQYVVTIVVIAGVINAINLMDGIDGLAALLSIIMIAGFSWIAYQTGNHELIALYAALAGALISFLRFNFSKTRKIFMGDAGSLFLGFIMVTSGIYFLGKTPNSNESEVIMPTVVGLLFIPVIDSLRVYVGRLYYGKSPFRPDKTHFHHLMLGAGFKHKSATLLMSSIAATFVVVTIYFVGSIGFSQALLILLVCFTLVIKFISMVSELKEWAGKIRQQEKL